MWNAAGEEPPGISALQDDLDTAVWIGDWALPPHQQGLNVLGTPFGSDAYIQPVPGMQVSMMQPYDTMSRESFLTALQDVAPSLLPFVRFFYARMG